MTLYRLRCKNSFAYPQGLGTDNIEVSYAGGTYRISRKGEQGPEDEPGQDHSLYEEESRWDIPTPVIHYHLLSGLLENPDDCSSCHISGISMTQVVLQ